MTTSTQPTFSKTDRAAIAGLCRDLTQRVGRKVTPEYGEDDHGGLWAALCVDSLPPGSYGRPGPLVSIVVIPRGPGGAEGAAGVMGADGSSLVDGVTLTEAVQAARFAGVREYRRKSEGALQAA